MSGHLRPRTSSRGQALVEFAAVSMLLLVMILGIMDFGFLFAGRVATTNAVRTAARFGAANSSAWTNSPNPPSNTIEGRLRTTAVPAVIINDDAHVVIKYVVPGLGSGTVCGQWSVSANAFQPVTGYTQSTCVTSGNLVSVQATYTYSFITPMLSQSFTNATITTEATEMVEN